MSHEGIAYRICTKQVIRVPQWTLHVFRPADTPADLTCSTEQRQRYREKGGKRGRRNAQDGERERSRLRAAPSRPLGPSQWCQGLDQLSRNGSGYSRWVELDVAAGIIIISGDNIFVVSRLSGCWTGDSRVGTTKILCFIVMSSTFRPVLLEVPGISREVYTDQTNVCERSHSVVPVPNFHYCIYN